jgi:DNA-binding CsgD family transcriptional regulator
MRTPKTTQTPRARAAATAKRAANTRKRRSDPLVKAEESRRILNLFIAGARVDEIARTMELSVETVYRERRAALEAAVPLRDKAADELREIELQRLDRLQRAHWTQATEGHIGSSKIVLMCIDRRCKMLGLDAPVKVDATVRSELDAQIEQLVEELAAEGLVKLVE